MNTTEINDMQLTRQKWVNEGGIFFPISGNTVLLKTPGKGVFNVVKSQNPMDARLGLQRIADTFEFNFKIYELGCEEMLQTIKTTWESPIFVEGNKNLGVIFNGLKGTGKTLSAKLLCNALDLPVVIVQYPYEGLVNFLQSLCFECIITVKVSQKNGDTYIIERKIVYDEKKKYNRVLSSQLIAKIRKDEFNPVPTRPKRGKSAVLDAKVQILNASRMRVGMMDIVAHIGDVSGIDSAIYAATDLGTAQKIISLARYLLATGGQTLPGNLPDVVTVKNAITQMNALGLKTTELVTDNGYHSQQNLSELLLAGFDFLTLVKTTLAWVRDEIDRHRKDFDGIMTACPFDTSTHGVTVMLMRDFQKVRKYGGKASGKQAGDVETFSRRIYLHLFFNQMRQAEDKVAFDTELMDIKSLLEEGKKLEELSEPAQRKAEKYLKISHRGGRLSVTFNEEACADANKYHGFFALVANKEKETFEVLSKYRKRNTIEAFFRGDKQTADGLRPRVWNADTLRGRMFVQFVAMCYYEYFNEQLRQLKKRLGTATGDEKHDTKAVLEAERKLKAWIDNTPVYLQLQWFDTVENVKVSSILANKRWTTEITSRDAMYLEKLGVKLTV